MQQARSVLFGRDRELAEIDLALARSAAGTSQVLLVGGDAGIGKTSLVTELAERGQASGFTVLTGHCLDIGTRRPFGAVRDALQTYLSQRDDEALSPVTRRLAPLLRAQTGPGVETGPNLLEGLRLVLTELAGQGPVLLTLEDMHWAGRSTQEFAVAGRRGGTRTSDVGTDVPHRRSASPTPVPAGSARDRAHFRQRENRSRTTRP